MRFEEELLLAIATSAPPRPRAASQENRGQLGDAIWAAALAGGHTARSPVWCLRMLDLTELTTEDALRRAFRRRARRLHPDRGGSHDDFLLLQRALTEARALLHARSRAAR